MNRSRQFEQSRGFVKIPPDRAESWHSRLQHQQLDVVASTEAKTRMRALAVDDSQLSAMYKRFYRHFLSFEDRLYERLLNQQGELDTPALDWRKLFVVKGIGDEVWILYTVPNGPISTLRTATARILQAALELASSHIIWRDTERGDEHAEVEEELNQRADSMNLPFKVYIDLAKDAFEIGKMRARELVPKTRTYLDPLSETLSADHLRLASRLNFAYVEGTARSIREVFRTDYIGHEIDRFFRTSKSALPGTVTIGEALFDELNIVAKPIVYPGLFSAGFSWDLVPASPYQGGRGRGNLLYTQTDLPERDLKGIGYSYRAYHIATLPHLNLIHGDDLFDKHVVEAVRVKFSESMVDGLKTLRQRQAVRRD